MSRPGEPAPDYRRVRAQLKERGYLGEPLGRFLFDDWLHAPTRVKSWWRPALKAALLGTPLLSALLAAVVARANRPLVGAADFPLLWLYFAPLAALFLLLLDGIVAGLNRWVSRRTRARGGAGTRAALIAGLPTLAYLVILARWTPTDSSWLYEALFLLLAVVTIVTISWLAGLVSVADVLARTGQVVGRGGRSLRTLVPIVLVATIAALALRAVLPAGPKEPEPPLFETRLAPRLVVVGIDGLDGEWIETLAPTGAVDALLQWMESGVVVPLAGERGSPPEVWTSMMTGLPVEVHGTRGAGAERLPGVATPLERSGRSLPLIEALRFLLPTRTVPVSGASRRVRTLWEIVGLKRAALAVGWWGSWPAAAEHGSQAWIVSDRVLPKLLVRAGWDRDTWPEPLFASLETGFADLREAIRAELDRRVESDIDARLRTQAGESMLIDAFALGTVADLWRRGEFEAAFLYLPGLDILRTRLVPAADVTDAAMLQRARVLEAYTAWLSRAVGGLLDELGPAVTTVLLADPGRAAAPSAEGLLVARGAGIPTGCIEPPVDLHAAAAAVLTLAGFPQGEEMEPFDPRGCLATAFSARMEVASYGWRAIDTAGGWSDYDPEMLERLKSLGYLN